MGDPVGFLKCQGTFLGSFSCKRLLKKYLKADFLDVIEFFRFSLESCQ